jgi:hypothetical protein
MDLSKIIKAGAGWYVLLLPLTLALICMGGAGFVAALRFVLESLSNFGAA